MMNAKQVAKWREAHPNISIPEDLLATAGPWPSLKVSDFLVYITDLDGVPKETASFVRDLGRECAWAYGNWAREQRDSNARDLIADMLNNARQPDDAPINSFLRDYAKANNLELLEPEDGEDWERALGTIEGASPVPVPPAEVAP